MPSWKRQRKGSQSLDLEEKKVKESITAAAAAAHAAAAGPDGDGGVLVEGQAPPGEIFREPAGFLSEFNTQRTYHYSGGV